MRSIFAIALATLLFIPCSAHASEDRLANIVITSEVKVKTAPDIATITAGVVTSSPVAATALQENAQKMNAVFAALKKAGIAEKDMQSSGINIHPEYDYQQNQKPRVTGYQVINNVTVILRDIDNIGATIDALVAEGVNQLSGPSFSVDDPEPLLDKARAEAVRKARKRADIYAEAAGVSIKRILSIMEHNALHVSPRPMMMRSMGMELKQEETPVAPGEVELGVTVNVSYEIE